MRRQFQRRPARSFNSRSRFAGSRTGIRNAKPPQRYIPADFFAAIVTDHPTGSATMQLNMIHLASVAISYWGAAQESAVDRKAIEVGGIVFDYGVEFPSTGGDAGGGILTDLENMSTFYNVGLCYDRLVSDTTTGESVPVCINTWEPFVSDFPINTVTPNFAQASFMRPTRVLWNKTHYVNFATGPILNFDDDVVVPQNQPVRTRNGTVNRRLRLRLDADHGLFLHVATLNEGNFAVDPAVLFRTVWFKGTLYWRPSN